MSKLTPEELADHRDWVSTHEGTDLGDLALTLFAHIDAITPRIVTTVEELDALPAGTVIRCADGRFLLHDRDMGIQGGALLWWRFMSDDYEWDFSEAFPATVIYAPEG